MRSAKLAAVLTVLATLAPAVRAQDSAQLRAAREQMDQARRAQDSAQQAAQQAQIRAMLEQIVRNRPPQAEAAARDLLRQLQLQQATLDSLRARSQDQYWQEVAQLTVQAQMLSNVADSLRRNLMGQMFGAEARARELQRVYRDGVDSAREAAIRARLQVILERHLAAEDSLRALEVADVERRIAQIRAETERRRRERAELVRRMVEQVLEDARRP